MAIPNFLNPNELISRRCVSIEISPMTASNVCKLVTRAGTQAKMAFPVHSRRIRAPRRYGSG
jgi:hypothetical protein